MSPDLFVSDECDLSELESKLDGHLAQLDILCVQLPAVQTGQPSFTVVTGMSTVTVWQLIEQMSTFLVVSSTWQHSVN